MSDAFYIPNRPPMGRVPEHGERLFAFLHGHDRYVCELRDYGKVYGIEAQFSRMRRFSTVAGSTLDWTGPGRRAS